MSLLTPHRNLKRFKSPLSYGIKPTLISTSHETFSEFHESREFIITEQDLDNIITGMLNYENKVNQQPLIKKTNSQWIFNKGDMEKITTTLSGKKIKIYKSDTGDIIQSKLLEDLDIDKNQKFLLKYFISLLGLEKTRPKIGGTRVIKLGKILVDIDEPLASIDEIPTININIPYKSIDILDNSELLVTKDGVVVEKTEDLCITIINRVLGFGTKDRKSIRGRIDNGSYHIAFIASGVPLVFKFIKKQRFDGIKFFGPNHTEQLLLKVNMVRELIENNNLLIRYRLAIPVSLGFFIRLNCRGDNKFLYTLLLITKKVKTICNMRALIQRREFNLLKGCVERKIGKMYSRIGNKCIMIWDPHKGNYGYLSNPGKDALWLDADQLIYIPRYKTNEDVQRCINAYDTLYVYGGQEGDHNNLGLDHLGRKPGFQNNSRLLRKLPKYSIRNIVYSPEELKNLNKADYHNLKEYNNRVLNLTEYLRNPNSFPEIGKYDISKIKPQLKYWTTNFPNKLASASIPSTPMQRLLLTSNEISEEEVKEDLNEVYLHNNLRESLKDKEPIFNVTSVNDLTPQNNLPVFNVTSVNDLTPKNKLPVFNVTSVSDLTPKNKLPVFNVTSVSDLTPIDKPIRRSRFIIGKKRSLNQNPLSHRDFPVKSGHLSQLSTINPAPQIQDRYTPEAHRTQKNTFKQKKK